jgi:hypothetical protein
VRDWTPVPQDLEQAVQAFQECSQSMGQGWVLQFCSAETGAHTLPPWARAVTTDLARVWTPPPQSSEQADQAVQPESLQSIGQAKVLQDLALPVLGQARPPWAVAVKTERLRNLVPVAQVLEQLVKADQLETLQSTGQAKVLQALELPRAGQATPPCWAEVSTERLRDLVPVAQDLEQPPKADQLDTFQSIVLEKVLQVLYSLVRAHAAPPWAVAVTTERVRRLVPVAQVTEQLVKADQPETLQSTGQAWRLHTRVSLVGHSSPPCLAAMSTW